MVFPIDQAGYKLAKQQGFLTFDNSVFLHELIQQLNFNHQNAWLIFTPKPTLVYNPDLQKSVEKYLTKIQFDFNSETPPRHFVYVHNRFPYPEFIKAAKMDFWINPHRSDFILIHQSNLDFINKFYYSGITKEQIKNHYWRQRWKYIQPHHLIRPTRHNIHAFSLEDHIFINHNIVADMTNQYKSNFSLCNSNVTVSLDCIRHLDSRFYIQKVQLILRREFTDIFHQI